MALVMVFVAGVFAEDSDCQDTLLRKCFGDYQSTLVKKPSFDDGHCSRVQVKEKPLAHPFSIHINEIKTIGFIA